MTVEKLKQSVIEAIDARREYILRCGQDIYATPELGFKEWRTSKRFVASLEGLGMEVEKGLAITGCRARLGSNVSGPRIALLGELDSVVVPDHPDSIKSTQEGDRGAVHACGHNIQLAGLLGAAVGLYASGVLEHLSGGVDIIATPAEECLEFAYRQTLKDEGKLKCFSGKQEMVRLGVFDDVDMSMMFHSLELGEMRASLGRESNGFISKQVRFIGKAAHAGSAPHLGVNALNAACLAIMNINAQRETFKDSDHVRVHSIITKGGDIVNVVPSDVRLEAMVRARTLVAIQEANEKVNRTIRAAADAVGAQVEIIDSPGYLPLVPNQSFDALFKENLEALGCEGKISEGQDFAGSTDFGDLTHIMPAIHPMIAGVQGDLHSTGFHMTDADIAILLPAKAMALTVIDLLANGAKMARELLSNFSPRMSRQEYLDYLDLGERN
jgi:amidohydrolase